MAVDIGLGGTIYFGRTEAVFAALALLWLLFWAWRVVGARSVPRGHWLHEALVIGPSRFAPPPEAAGRWGLIFLAGALGMVFSSPVYKTGYLLLRWPGVVLAVAACGLLYLWLFRMWLARPLRQVVLMGMAFAGIGGIVIGMVAVVQVMTPHCEPLAWTAVPGEREVALVTEEPGARLVLTQLHYSEPCAQNYKDPDGRRAVDMNMLAVLENRGSLPIIVQDMGVKIDGVMTGVRQPAFWEYRFPLLPPGGRLAFAARVEDSDLPVWPSPAVSLGDFTAIIHPVTESVAAGVTLVPVDVSGAPDWGGWGWSEDPFPAYTVRGHVRNDGVTEACDFNAYVAVYDARDQLVGAGNTAIKAGEFLDCLPPGATTAFALSLDNLAGMADHYEVWFQARPTRHDDW